MNNINLSKKLHGRNFRKYGLDMNLFVSMVSAVLVLGFIIFIIAKPNESAEMINDIKNYINIKYNWFFIFTINFALIFTMWLSFSKFGKIKLGGPEAKPEFSNFSWYSIVIYQIPVRILS